MIEKSVLEKLLGIQAQLIPVTEKGPKIHMGAGYCPDCSYGCEGSCSNRCAGCSGQCKDSCNHGASGSGGDGCFITTATCKSFNKLDDCHELTALRSFRDNFMKKDELMQSEVEEYYEIAPKICSCIDCHENSDEIYQNIWSKWLKDAVLAVDNGQNQKAYSIYKDMVLSLKQEFLR